LKPLIFVAAVGAASCALAQEMVTVPSRPGVTQSFVILPMEGRESAAIALLYVGGGGRINARSEDGQVRFGARNFLPRSGAEFVRNRILPVVMDAPSDQGELTDGYRMEREQTADARAVIAELTRRYPGLPVYLVGTSRGTISAAFVGRDLGSAVAGVVLTSTMFGSTSPRRQAPTLRGFDYAGISSPLLFVHHRADGCEHTPYAAAARLAPRYPLISVSGGRPAESGPCEPFSAHGYFGREAQTVDAIAGWILKRPFPQEVE
jgi:predicted alpha/beta-hydrolase family hydrolase